MVLGHLGTWTSRYSVPEISVLNNKNNLIEFKNFLKKMFTCRRCLFKKYLPSRYIMDGYPNFRFKLQNERVFVYILWQNVSP